MTKSGIQNPKVLDVVAYDPSTDTYVLVMVETRRWGTSNRQLLELQEKINTYLSFALDGELIRKFPDSQGKAIRLQLDSVTEPDADTWRFIDIAREKLETQGIDFVVNLI